MRHHRTITALVMVTIAGSAAAAGLGIFSTGGPGPSVHQSIRGASVTIYGTGLYRQMSAEVAPQGIAQDYVTFFLGIPLLLGSLAWARSGSVRGRVLLAGTLGYFMVTYLFYLMMAMYNTMFLVYVALLASSFFALAVVLLGFDVERLPSYFGESTPVRTAGCFLVFNAGAICFLWLGVVVPPLLDGTVVPMQVEHYTTLVVQGLDLALLLPLGFLSGLLLVRRRPLGFLMAPVYLVFLALLMTALSAKVAAMELLGFSTFPVVFIIPTLNACAAGLAVLTLKQIRNDAERAPSFAPRPTPS